MGELFSLLTAVFFAASVICFKMTLASTSALGLTLFKNCIALVLLAGTTLALGHASVNSVSPRDLAIIVFSGALGVGVSDVLFLMALKRLGTSRTAIVDCLYPPFVIVFSLFMLNEQMTIRVILGGTLILASVLICSQRNYGEPLPRMQFLTGCGLGISSMLVIAFAIVLVKPLLSTYPLSWVSTVRMAGGTAVLALILPFLPNRQAVYDAFRPRPMWKWMLLGTLSGAYLSTLTWLAGFRYTEAGTSAVLNQTSTVLIVMFAWMFLGESMTKLKLVAVGIAFAGAVLVVT